MEKSYTIVPEDEEVTISSVESDDNAITPSKMLTSLIAAINIIWILFKM
jgi:hypothetical protein